MYSPDFRRVSATEGLFDLAPFKTTSVEEALKKIEAMSLSPSIAESIV